MRKRPFLIFAAIVGLLVGGAIWFIQSAQFARIVKKIAQKHLPADLGIDADFSEFAVKLFPPGVSIKAPKVTIKEKNIAKLPPGSTVVAERIDLNFLPFQMFSGNIRVNEVVVVNGEVNLLIDPDAMAGTAPAVSKKSRTPFRWDELVQVRAEAIVLQNTRLHVESADPELSVDLVTRSLKLAQWNGKGGGGFELSLDLDDIHGRFPKGWPLPESLQRVQAGIRVNVLGLQVDNLSAQTDGMEFSVSGALKGNLLNPKSLMAEGNLNLRGELEKGLQVIKRAIKTKIGVTGRFAFSGKVKANLLKAMETLHAEGLFTAEEVRLQKWKIDRIKAEGIWQSAPGGGEVEISNAVLSSPEVKRSGGFQAGGGGKIELGNFKLRLGSDEPMQFPLKLDRAHLHWLAAPALRDVYPLDMRVSGPVHLSYSPGRAWGMVAKADLSIDDFQLDNQRLNQTKALHRVLRIPRIKLNGDVLIDSGGIRPNGLLVSLPNSKIKMNGKIDFKTGFDLSGAGNVNLQDIGQIAENDIRGSGNLSVHVHGPSARTIIDFDVDAKDAYYIHLHLGDMKGRITWDDDPQNLIFTQVRLAKPRTLYTGEGMIALGRDNRIALNLQIKRGDISDFINIFQDLTKDLWWFPHSLTGAMTGKIQVSGGLGLDELEVLAHVNGSDWEFLGERFKTVALEGGYERGRYHLLNARALKRGGMAVGKISYDKEKRFDWELRTSDFSVSDFDHIAQLDVPIRGRLSIQSRGKTLQGSIKSETQISLTDLSVRGVSMAPSQLLAKSEGGILQLTGIALGGQGILECSYDWKTGGASSLRAEASHLDFSPIFLLLNPRLTQDTELESFASGAFNLNFRSGQVEKGSGFFELNEGLLAKTNTKFKLARPVSFRINGGSFDLKTASVRGPQGEAVLSLQSREGNLEGTIEGALDVGIAEFLTSTVSRAVGVAVLDFAIGGSVKEPTIFGKAGLEGATIRIPSVESPFENVTGALQLRQNILTVQNVKADLAGGRVSTQGTITVFADRYPTLDLKAILSGNKLKVFPFQFVKVRGGINVHGEDIPYLVDGNLTIESALSREKVLGQKAGEGLKSVQYMPPPNRQRESDYPKFKLNIETHAERGVIVQNDLFDAELKGKLTVVNTLETPRLVGTAELVQGKMIFKNRSFQILSANANFDSPTVINPVFDLTANTDVNNTKIQLYAAGRLDKWKIEMTSNPAMPESEILSLLALGLTSSDVKRLSAEDRTVVEQGEAASLLLHSLDFNREVQSKTGLQIQLDETLNSGVGTSIARPQGDRDSAAAPKIVIKKRISDRLELSYGSTVGVGTSNQKEVNAELKVTPGFSVIGVWDRRETVDTQNNTDASGSYGMDLKWQKRFK